MATIKHLTSKNSNYAAAESYLTFQHNEYTGLPILDEKGRPKHTVVVAQGGEDALAALAALSAQCSKVGSNLNQLARHFNSGGKDTEQLRAQILEELSALTNFRLKAEETVGELYGNHQAFDLEKL